MLCPACQAAAPDGSRFCPSCGAALIAADTSAAHEATRLVEAATVLATADLTTAARAPLSTPSIAGAPLDLSVLAPGTLLAARYRIIRPLGRGGMGVVYQADDLRLDHQVALKFLPEALARDARRLEQFHGEVRVARQISHANVCRVYDIGDVDGHLFLSMEYIAGEDLASVLRRRGKLPETEAIELTRQIGAGLAAVHASGVLHRDLKPANIMISGGSRAQLMDFGIAVAGGSDQPDRITEGTPAYMAPEQLASRPVSVQSDLYALGVLMFEMFTGRRPFDATTIDALASQQAQLVAAPPPDLNGLRPRIRDVILQCLDTDPSRRPASAGAIIGMLQTVLLEARARGRRIVQTISQLLLLPLAIGGATLVGRGGWESAIGVLALAAAATLGMIEWRMPLSWTVVYKGHRIRLHNHALLGERLYIDDRLVDRGRIGFRVTLRGTIEGGAGAGERITAEVTCSFWDFSCVLVAEAFG